MQNHFDLFGLTPAFEIDLGLLEQHYRQLQAKVHPDKFVSASPAEQLQSLQTATQANDAYQTLKNPTSRARYLLRLQGIDTDDENNTAMPADFLMLQMEWREAIDDAKDSDDIDALDDLLDQFRQEITSLHQLFSQTLQSDINEAASIVRKLSFIDKIKDDVTNLLTELED